MLPDIVGAVAATALGIGISALNYYISRLMLLKCPDKFAYSTVFRTLVLVLFLIATYFIGSLTPCDLTWLLVGAALGATLPSFFFTSRLLKLNQKLMLEKKTSENTKEKEE